MICKFCDNEMKDGISCTLKIYDNFNDGAARERIKFGDEKQKWRNPCHDCRVNLGDYHHPGCDVEECPRCGFQAISCDCLEN